MLNRATLSNPIGIPIVVTGGGGKSAIVAVSLESENCGVVFYILSDDGNLKF
jgi:hypothetical protein